eukprot:gene10247-11949_t
MQYLGFLLDSLEGQTFKDWEVIIVDDGSTEWAADAQLQGIFNRYSQRMNITVTFESNGGLSWARNHGIKLATGKWILPLDSDDAIDRNLLQRSVDIIDNGHSIGEAWQLIQGYDTSLWFGWEDWDFWLRLDRSLSSLNKKGLDVRVIHDAPFLYRMKPGMHSLCKDQRPLCFAMFQTIHPHEYPITMDDARNWLEIDPTDKDTSSS